MLLANVPPAQLPRPSSLRVTVLFLRLLGWIGWRKSKDCPSVREAATWIACEFSSGMSYRWIPPLRLRCTRHGTLIFATVFLTSSKISLNQRRLQSTSALLPWWGDSWSKKVPSHPITLPCKTVLGWWLLLLTEPVKKPSPRRRAFQRKRKGCWEAFTWKCTTPPLSGLALTNWWLAFAHVRTSLSLRRTCHLPTDSSSFWSPRKILKGPEISLFSKATHFLKRWTRRLLISAFASPMRKLGVVNVA